MVLGMYLRCWISNPPSGSRKIHPFSGEVQMQQCYSKIENVELHHEHTCWSRTLPQKPVLSCLLQFVHLLEAFLAAKIDTRAAPDIVMQDISPLDTIILQTPAWKDSFCI